MPSRAERFAEIRRRLGRRGSSRAHRRLRTWAQPLPPNCPHRRSRAANAWNHLAASRGHVVIDAGGAVARKDLELFAQLLRSYGAGDSVNEAKRSANRCDELRPNRGQSCGLPSGRFARILRIIGSLHLSKLAARTGRMPRSGPLSCNWTNVRLPSTFVRLPGGEFLRPAAHRDAAANSAEAGGTGCGV